MGGTSGQRRETGKTDLGVQVMPGDLGKVQRTETEKR